jgi:hypothetical protein
LVTVRTLTRPAVRTCVELKEWIDSISATKKQVTEFLDTILPRTAATLNNTQKAQLVNFREKLFSTGLTDEEKQVRLCLHSVS